MSAIGIVDHHLDEAGKLAHQIGDLGVAGVGAVLLEGEAHHQHTGVVHLDLSLQHRLDDVAGDETCHAVIDAAAGQDHFGVEADRLRLVRQVIGIDTDTVTADKAWAVGVEVPFGAGGFQHLAGVETEILEQHGEFVDQRDVHVALNVLDDLGGLRHADRSHAMGAGRDNAAIDAIDKFGDLGRRAGCDFNNVGKAMLEIAGVDALGRIAGEEILVEDETGGALQNRHANFFGGAGIDRRFIHHHVAGAQRLADRLARAHQRGEIGPLRLVDRGRHGDDIEIATLERLRIGAEGQRLGGSEFVVGDLTGAVLA